MPFIYIRYADVALSILISDLDNAESKAHFINSYTALHTLSYRFPIAKEVSQLILERARQLQTDLPEEITCLHPLVESEFNQAFYSSLAKYPNDRSPAFVVAGAGAAYGWTAEPAGFAFEYMRISFMCPVLGD